MEEVKSGKPVVISLLTGLAKMYFVTALLLVILSVLVWKMQLQKNLVSAGVIATYIISCLVGGLAIGKKVEKRRFLWGMLAGILYFAVLIGGTFLFEHTVESETNYLVTVFVMCMFSGMAGAIIRST